MPKLNLSQLTAKAAQRLAQPKGAKSLRQRVEDKPCVLPVDTDPYDASDPLLDGRSGQDGSGVGGNVSSRPLVELLKDAVPEPTAFEQAWDASERATAALPRSKPGPDPRKPWIGKGEMTEPEPIRDPIERSKLNNAVAKAKLGKRLTFKERKLLGKHQLARIMVRIRKKGGDCG